MKPVRRKCLIALLPILFFASSVQPQTINRLDSKSLYDTALTAYIRQLMNTAHVAGLGIIVFNSNQPVYIRTFGYANLPEKNWMIRRDEV